MLRYEIFNSDFLPIVRSLLFGILQHEIITGNNITDYKIIDIESTETHETGNIANRNNTDNNITDNNIIDNTITDNIILILILIQFFEIFKIQFDFAINFIKPVTR